MKSYQSEQLLEQPKGEEFFCMARMQLRICDSSTSVRIILATFARDDKVRSVG